jgi:hypothetical protein
MSGEDLEKQKFEKLKWDYERTTRHAERTHDRHHEDRDNRNEAAVTAGNNVLRALMFINGGAAVAMLAFVGAFAGKDKIDLVSIAPLAPSLLIFAFGALSSVASMGAGYFVNYCRAEADGLSQLTWDHPYVERNEASNAMTKRADAFQWSAIALGFLSGIMFLWGTIDVKNFIGKLAKQPTVYVAPSRGSV